MFCSQCGVPNQETAQHCVKCNAILYRVNYREPTADVNYNTNSLGGLIPYKNVPSLVSYYCGLFSLIPIPVVNFILGLVAIIAGVKGRKLAKIHPEIKGGGHVIAGFILGGIGFVIGSFFLVVIIVSIIYKI